MCVYPNLDKAIREKGISKKYLAERVNIRYQTFIVKCNGKNDFTFDETLCIKKELGTNMMLEQLFERTS
ncbi:MAG: XRE family transcriptional regulator [Oscillospiraceae bacterium]|nr:XRE family transcriptional regulator [Oscillospiraceae bacterium]